MEESEASDRVLQKAVVCPNMFKVGCLGGGSRGKHLQSTVGCCLFSRRQQQNLLKNRHPSLPVPKHRSESGWEGLAWCGGLTPAKQELNLPRISGDWRTQPNLSSTCCLFWTSGQRKFLALCQVLIWVDICWKAAGLLNINRIILLLPTHISQMKVRRCTSPQPHPCG